MDLIKMLIHRGVRLTSAFLRKDIDYKLTCDVMEYLTHEHGPNAERAKAE